MKFNVLTEEDLANGIKFKVYLNYILSLASELKNSHYTNLDHLKYVVSSKDFKNILSQKKHFDGAKVNKLLRNAWLTELQLNFAKTNPGLVPYANHWGCVQIYYSSYLAMRSLLIVMNHSSLDVSAHSSTISNVNKEILKRPLLFPFPWNILCVGNPNSSSINFKNIPEDIDPVHNNNSFGRDVSFLDRYCQFLKTTRQRTFKEKKNEWLKKNKRKRFPNNQIETLLKSMSPTSFFDCLFRLRVRSNYMDSDIFASDAVSNNDALAFNNALQDICHHTLQILELIISAYYKISEYRKVANDFLRKQTDSVSLNMRLAAILECYNLN